MVIGRGSLSGVRALLLALLGGCFNPTYNHPACGTGNSCPSGLFCVAGFCETSPGDAADCWRRWFDGEPALQLTMPQPLGGLCPQDRERDPWISADGERLYFTCMNGMDDGRNDLYFATRASAADSFSKVTALIDLNTTDDEERPALTDDEKMLVFASNRGGSRSKLFVTMRDPSGKFPSPGLQDQQMLSNVNADISTNYYDPFLTMNGLRLYLAPSTNQNQHIEVTTRAEGQNFPASARVQSLADATGNDGGPALSSDERVIVFSSTRPGGPNNANLWYATRQDAMDPFGMPRLVPTVNGGFSDTNPMLNFNGCELYFTSFRPADGRAKIYLARVMQ